ncbi:MAG: arginine--tRNA ligase [candidate division Zixibacteria bacterium HGW-Zixibacteria-1]|nr:MAG: arginine--tRNA ligase [candidate division Zixibacteria bacterium HGW-Zixibacteria-1]
MTKDKFKIAISECTAKAFIELLPSLYEEQPDHYLFDGGRLYEMLETPKKPEMGNTALPLFSPAKEIGKNPMELNKQLAEAQNRITRDNDDYSFLSFTAVGGFNNARIATEALASATLPLIISQDEDYGSSNEGGGRNIVIDFSSPNIAKPFGVAHLRTTALGHSLYRIFEKLGYKSIGINHLGDWGTQFGKMIVAFRKWGREEDLERDAVLKLYDLYVRFHREEETDPSLADEAREAFRRLEQGEHDEAHLWNLFKEVSLEAFKETYKMLGIHFDYFTGESFYNEKMPEVVERLNKAGLTRISEGALIVDLDKFGLPPCILAKGDGATLYATRDITGVVYRWETFNFHKALYVVGTAQRDHFKQVFKVIELLEEAENVPPEKRCSQNLEHVEFGWIKFKDQTMSTRRGNIILLDDVLDKAITLAREKIAEKNPNLELIDQTARQIGIGAVLFADMSARRMKDINFDWDEVLNFEGETGPYLQYTHARLSSLLRHYDIESSAEVNYSMLDNPEEHRVLDLLYKFPETINEAARNYEPYLIGSHLIELAGAFNKVYQRKDDTGRMDKIISDDPELSATRMALVKAVKIVIQEGLYLMGIEAPDEM